MRGMKAVIPILIVVLIAAIGVCLLAGWAFLRLGVTVEPVPTRVELRDGFAGALEGRWRQVNGGFTGDEALTPLETDLSPRWPNGSVVQLSFLASGEYELTIVEASGSGAFLAKVLHRERGRSSLTGNRLMLTPTQADVVRREHGERTAARSVPAPRTYVVRTQVKELPRPPGAAPSTEQALHLTGPCVAQGGSCEWSLESEQRGRGAELR